MAADPQDEPRHAGQVVRRVLLRSNIAIDGVGAGPVAGKVAGAVCGQLAMLNAYVIQQAVQTAVSEGG